MNAREMAFDLLVGWEKSRVRADEFLADRMRGEDMSTADRALATELFYGCLRNKLALEYLVGRMAPKKPRPTLAAILMLGVYQIFFLERIPAHAAVHETVELAKRHASAAEAKFVNALLRRLAQNLATYVTQFSTLRHTEPWVYYSHPRWLLELWQSRWTQSETRALCEWNNAPPAIYIRLNTLKLEGRDSARPSGSHGVVARTEPCPPNGIALEPCESHPLCFRVNDPTGLFDSPAWLSGKLYVQDPSTLLAVDVLDPQPGESVLDMCAAPGGKTTYIAQKMQNRGEIIAADSSSSRLALVGENCRRLGVEIVSTIACDGTRLNRCLRRTGFDRVLVDAPCSNTGVLRRRPDLRWRIEAKEIERLGALQQKLLATGASFTRQAGVLVYSTCSLEPEENERVVDRFCESHPQFTLETTRSTFPPRDGVDGAFVARLRCN